MSAEGWTEASSSAGTATVRLVQAHVETEAERLRRLSNYAADLALTIACQEAGAVVQLQPLAEIADVLAEFSDVFRVIDGIRRSAA